MYVYITHTHYEIRVHINKAQALSYRRGGLRLLVLTNWAIPTASDSGASNGYRLHVFFVYVSNLNLTINHTKSESL